MHQPLKGIRIVELAGLAPAPFAAMMLADHGAEVIRIERAGWTPPIPPDKDILAPQPRRDTDARSQVRRGRREDCASWPRDADGLIEGFRPGVMERLGLGPETLLRRQSAAGLRADDRLGPGRAAGPGGGPRHQLHRARRQPPHLWPRRRASRPPPVNAVGDFGGGGMLLAFAMLAGILSARTTGKGQRDRLRDGRRRRLARRADLVAAGRRHVEGRARRQSARFRRRLLRQLRMRRRPVGRGRRARAAILRRAQGTARPGLVAARSRACATS